MLAQDSKIPFEYDELDIDKLVAEMNQTLWKSICILIQSESERRGTSKATDPSTAAYHIKKIRRFFLLCNVLFCTDDRCSFPLHTLVTDVVESQGGSTLLIKFISPELTELQQHSAWLEDIRQNIWDRIKFENNMIPSHDSLHHIG